MTRLPPYPSAGDEALAAIRLEAVTLVRGTQTVFENLSLDLVEARIGFIGDNGAGKTSLFRLICGLEQPQSGRVHMPVAPSSRGAPGIGLMFQNPDEQLIFPTVEEELGLSLASRGLGRREVRTQVRQWLERRGMAHWAERSIASLSQGQRQHVCWLGLLIASPGVLLLDEPYASLDLPGQALLRQEIAGASQQVLVSTHQLEHVRDFERVIWLDDGKVRSDGPGHEVCARYQADVAWRTASRQLSFDNAAATGGVCDAPQAPEVEQ